MTGPAPLRDILIIAGFELREMLRTRRAVVLIALYLLAGILAASLFVEAISSLEQTVAKALGTKGTTSGGNLTTQVLNDPAYRKNILDMFDDKDLANYLLTKPPIALFFQWISFLGVPGLIMMTASDTVAQETQNRGSRFTLLRTGRLEFVVGKVLGQTLLMALVTLLAGVVYAAVAAYGLRGFELVPTVSAIVEFWPRVVVYGFAFVGMATLLGAPASSTNIARAFSLAGLLLTSMVSGWSQAQVAHGKGDWYGKLSLILPYEHREALWYGDLKTLLPGMAMLLALGSVYTAIGLVLYSRRDL
jgi:ABC-type transport system involved in multi-copper enzyme maturation permease subunit